MVSRAWRRQRKPLHESDFFQDWGLGYTYQQAFFSEEGTGPTVTIQIG